MAKKKSDLEFEKQMRQDLRFPRTLRKAAIIAYGGPDQADNWFNQPQALSSICVRSMRSRPKGPEDDQKKHIRNQINLNESVFSSLAKGDQEQIICSSGNVFAEMGLPDAEELYPKARRDAALNPIVKR